MYLRIFFQLCHKLVLSGGRSKIAVDTSQALTVIQQLEMEVLGIGPFPSNYLEFSFRFKKYFIQSKYNDTDNEAAALNTNGHQFNITYFDVSSTMLLISSPDPCKTLSSLETILLRDTELKLYGDGWV